MIMRVELISLFCLLLLLPVVHAEAPPIQWERNLGDHLEEVAYDIAQTSDGGYIVAGTRYSANTTEDVYVLKLRGSGDVEWERIVYRPKINFAHSVSQTQDGGYILGGGTFAGSEGLSDFSVIKLHPDGSIEWEQTFGRNQRDVCERVVQTSDGGYMAAGDTWLNYYDQDILLVKFDPDGNIEWNVNIGGSEEDGAYDIQQTADKGYIIAGHTRSVSDMSNNAYIVKTDPEGRVEWTSEFGDSGDDQLYSIEQQRDGYVAAGYTTSIHEYSDIYVIKVNRDGEKVWEKVYGGAETQDDARSIKKTSDGGYILAGKTNEYSYGSYDMNLLKLDNEGNLQWSQVYGGQNNDMGYAALESSDQGYVIAGQTKSFDKGGDIYIIKTEGLKKSPPISRNLPEYGSPANGALLCALLILIAGMLRRRQ